MGRNSLGQDVLGSFCPTFSIAHALPVRAWQVQGLAAVPQACAWASWTHHVVQLSDADGLQNDVDIDFGMPRSTARLRRAAQFVLCGSRFFAPYWSWNVMCVCVLYL